MNNLKNFDFEIDQLINSEKTRQLTGINLIASENYVSPAILEATGSILTNKYAEGYPKKRYYAGCEFIDQIEELAIKRCKELFKAEHVNVQPHSGSQANMAVYNAILNPGDTIMGMSLSSGGHLTHGHSVNFSGSIYKTVQYDVNSNTHQLDYDNIEKLAQIYKPKLIIAGASAYSRFIDFERFSKIAKSIDAYLMADIAHIAGLIAAQLHSSPIEFADFVTSTTHKTLRGPRGGLIMCKEKYKTEIDRAIMPGTQGGPFMHIIAAKAVAFKEALQPDFRIYQQQVIKNAQTMVKRFQELGYKIVTDGTDNHLFIIDLRNKNITGKKAQELLDKANIFVSRSAIPFDDEKPWITSGIRIGTPAITTKGFKEKDVEIIADLIDQVLKNQEDSIEYIKDKIKKL
ncbi:serine hydroxymethyltransferase [Candidatus Babela massiliensis]|uniref:Serine hydroxymethyltransferase n=1 Tax=Candidatus Babela massiliensis TaxID=673862 RepID=V6DH52_9BACT|nr:serine hydroxymethyltransferase [Candidatus Babela massiliensis]CDK30874.1 Glycine/serine hydroxymethyltransferase [Candidatus Babela massiliensis]